MRAIILFTVFTLSIVASSLSSAQDKGVSGPLSVPPIIDPKTREIIGKGLRFLSTNQMPGGSFGGNHHGAMSGVVGLCGLAFLASGSTPYEGPYRTQVKRCTEYIIGSQRADGFYQGSPSDSMYGHGFATLYLTQIYGITDDKRVAESITKAMNLMKVCQSTSGGWRYRPEKSDADTSITVCQLTAIRAAADAGLTVPKGVRENALKYLESCQNENGTFTYTPGRGAHTTVALTAAGVVSFYSAGVYDEKKLEQGLDYVKANSPGSGGHQYYTLYYASQLIWTRAGKDWQEWYNKAKKHLSGNMVQTGVWSGGHGKAYSTAVALIVLQLPNNYLPAFYR
jgi:hypothetical protein